MSFIQHIRENPRAGYVLLMVTIVYFLNQTDRYLYSSEAPAFVTKKEFNEISGPLFTITFTVMGVAMSFLGVRWNRAFILGAALIFWSVMTGLAGFTTKFWQVAVVRIGQSLGEAACTPFATGLIAAYFPAKSKATAMSVYNVGIYSGFAFAQSVGTALSHTPGHWRTPYFFFGLLGVAIAVLLMVSVRDPTVAQQKIEDEKLQRLLSPNDRKPDAAKEPEDSAWVLYKKVFIFWLSSPSLVLLCIAGGVRNAGGYVWAYQVSNWFRKTQHVPDRTYSLYMLWIPLIGGSLGAILGGFISDKVVNRVRADGTKMGVRGRMLVVIVSNILAAPFAASALLIHHSAPWGFLSLIGSNVIGEMWIGVFLTIVLELTPKKMHTTSIAIYLFIITNIGGNAPLLVPSFESAFPHNGKPSLRNALLCLFPGTYVASSVIILLTMLFADCDAKRAATAFVEHVDEEPVKTLRDTDEEDGPLIVIDDDESAAQKNKDDAAR